MYPEYKSQFLEPLEPLEQEPATCKRDGSLNWLIVGSSSRARVPIARIPINPVCEVPPAMAPCKLLVPALYLVSRVLLASKRGGELE